MRIIVSYGRVNEIIRVFLYMRGVVKLLILNDCQYIHEHVVYK